MIKNLPAVREMQVQSLGQEDPLEEEMATRSSILAWRIPLTEEPGGLQSRGLQRARLSRLKRLSTHTCKLRAMAPRPESDLGGYRSYRID